jgi:HSP20 family protein
MGFFPEELPMSFWRRKKRRHWWEDFFRDFDEIMEEMMEDFQRMDEAERRSREPYVFGFSFSLGPDGRPVLREFGNVRSGPVKPVLSEEREPLMDIYEEGGDLVILAEVPGVDEEDIEINVSEDALEIEVDAPKRKYHKLVDLTQPVSTEIVRTTYKNGVLEVRLRKKAKERGWKDIEVR